MHKQLIDPLPPWKRLKDPMGLAPALLAKREIVNPNAWCPVNIEFDAWCDPDNPKTILHKDVYKAAAAIKREIPKTPLVKSKCCVRLGSEVFYKIESVHRTSSFHERGALYSLKMLNDDQKRDGVFTASTGNWAKALAYKARRLGIPATVVVPADTLIDVVEQIQDFGATVVTHGRNLDEAKRQAFVLMSENGCGTYINGYDHPHVIAAEGTIGIEIMEQLPQTDAILIPVGGGGLLAGVAAVVKHLNPKVLIYGIESNKCCCFYKALENERPYQTYCDQSLAGLAVPTAGCNAFHTARSLIDKMVLVDDDWITRAILHLVEDENRIAEGAGAITLSTFLTMPNVIPELREKTVVCLISGGNINTNIFPLCLDRGRAIEGRLIKVTVKLGTEDMRKRSKVLAVLASLGVNIRDTCTDVAETFQRNDLILVCETRGLKHTCAVKGILDRIFPNTCEFLEEPFSPIPICVCYPKEELL